MATLLIKRSNTGGKVPLASDLSVGELALNTTDNRLFFKNDTNAIIELTDLSTQRGILPISKGGTGSTIKNFVDLNTNQTVDGLKSLAKSLEVKLGTDTLKGISFTGFASGKTTYLSLDSAAVDDGIVNNGFLNIYNSSLQLKGYNGTRVVSNFGDVCLLGTTTSNLSLFYGDVSINGIINAPNTSRFRVYKTMTQGVLLSTLTKVSFQVESYDIKSEFDLTNNRFVAQSTGLYYFSTGITFATTNTRRLVLILYVNGAEHTRLVDSRVSATAATTLSGSCILQLNASDYVEVYASCDLALNINAGSNLSYFMGARLA